jgi:hypothetical protein
VGEISWIKDGSKKFLHESVGQIGLLASLVIPEGGHQPKTLGGTSCLSFLFSWISLKRVWLILKIKMPLKGQWFCVAEREGFEPPDLLQSTVFKTAAFDRSAISPRQKYSQYNYVQNENSRSR